MSVLTLAASHTGMIKETGSNGGFSDADFQDMMTAAGWRKGLAWCMFYAIALWLENAEDDQTRKAVRCLGGGTQAAWKNAEKCGFVIGKIPKVGAIAIFQKQGSTSSGHAAIVAKTSGWTEWFVADKRNGIPLKDNEFLTIEGNTDESGSREGDGVYAKVRTLTFDAPQKGSSNVLLGFIYAPWGVNVGGSAAERLEHGFSSLEDWQRWALGAASLGILGWGSFVLAKKN